MIPMHTKTELEVNILVLLLTLIGYVAIYQYVYKKVYFIAIFHCE